MVTHGKQKLSHLNRTRRFITSFILINYYVVPFTSQVAPSTTVTTSNVRSASRLIYVSTCVQNLQFIYSFLIYSQMSFVGFDILTKAYIQIRSFRTCSRVVW